jgi:hypothetical protein
MPDALERLKALEQAATPGPWEPRCLDYKGEQSYFKYVNGEQVYFPAYRIEPDLDTLGDHESGAMELPTAEFVSALRNAAPSLIEIASEAQVLMYFINRNGEPLDGFRFREVAIKLRAALAKLEGAIAP